MPTLSVALLGAFDVAMDGQPVTAFAYDKVRGLLAYLVVEADRPHRRDHLATLFWPDQDRRSARQSLSQALYRLRRVLDAGKTAAPFLLVTAQTIQVNPAAACKSDVRDFAALLDACQSHRHAQPGACPACLARLAQAVALYRGEFLEGFSLPDSPQFDEWALFIRERMQHLATEALRTQTHGYAKLGDYTAALACGRRWLALDPWQEEAHRQVMTALAASGQRSAALAQYETCRRTLLAELGVEPAPETAALHQRLRDGAAAQERVPGARHNLPAALTPLIGRSAELTAIGQYLRDPACRLVSLVGPGGSGKTRLAIEAATQLCDHFAGGALFASLAGVDAIQAIVPTLAQAIGLALARQEDARRQLLDFLRDKELLLVVDNFEHLLSAAPLLSAILAAAPHVRILVTSRAFLNLEGEQVITLGGLALPPPTLAADASAAVLATDAVALFLHHARRLQRDYAPDADDLAAIAQICRAVAGLPLAIVLAAAWMDLLSPPAIAHELLHQTSGDGAHGIDFLATDRPDLPERQQSMRTVLDQAWRLLSEQDQRVLATLALFRGGFTQDAAQAVAGASLRQLRTFVEKSWLHRAASNRYAMHELLRQYAEEKLPQRAAAACAGHERHCTYFAAALGRWADALRGGGQLTALAAVEADLDNAQAAWDWAVEQARFDAVGEALDGLCLYYDWRGLCQQGEQLCQSAVAHLLPLLEGARHPAMARLLAWHGWFSQVLDQLELAKSRLHECLALLDDLSPARDAHRSVRAFALYGLGHAFHSTDRNAAKRYWEASLALYRELADQWGITQALIHLGILARDTTDFLTARLRLEESIAISQALGDRKSMAYALGQLSSVYGNQDQLATALELGSRSIAISQELGDPLGAAESIGGMAGTLAYSGHLQESLARFEQTGAIYAHHGVRHGYAYSLHMAAWIYLNLGQYAHARQQYQAAQAIWLEQNHRHGLALSALGLGETALVFDEYDQAATFLADGVARFNALQQQDEEAITLAILAVALRGLGRRAEARCAVQQALQIALAVGAFAPVLFALDAFALILADEDDAARALAFYALVGQHAYLKHARWRQERYERCLLPRAAALSPETRAAAFARAQQGDIRTAALEVLAELRRTTPPHNSPPAIHKL